MTVETSHKHPAPSDVMGQVLSAICVVHCIGMPFFVSLLPAAASALGGAHPILLIAVVIVGLWAFVPGYRCHHNKSIIALAVVGVVLLALAALVFEGHPVFDRSFSVAGAICMMIAHLRNRHELRHRHDAHTHVGEAVHE